jgi:hypothetical protein
VGLPVLSSDSTYCDSTFGSASVLRASHTPPPRSRSFSGSQCGARTLPSTCYRSATTEEDHQPKPCLLHRMSTPKERGVKAARWASTALHGMHQCIGSCPAAEFHCRANSSASKLPTRDSSISSHSHHTPLSLPSPSPWRYGIVHGPKLALQVRQQRVVADLHGCDKCALLGHTLAVLALRQVLAVSLSHTPLPGVRRTTSRTTVLVQPCSATHVCGTCVGSPWWDRGVEWQCGAASTHQRTRVGGA